VSYSGGLGPMAEDDLRDKIRRLRESIPDEDSSVTHIHATGSKIVVQNVGAGNVKAGLDVSVPPKADKPIIIAVLSVLPPWGRVIIALAIITAAGLGGHTLGWW